MSDPMQRFLADALNDLSMKGNVYIDPSMVLKDGESLPPDVAVRKFAAYFSVSCCQLTDSTGVNHCEHPPPPPIPRWTRLRWRIRSWWSGLRMRLGSWVAGVDLDRDYDD